MSENVNPQVEAHFNPRIAVPDHQAYLARGAELSAQARARLGGMLDQRYGDGAMETADVFLPGDVSSGGANPGGRPVHVFIHGGYWRALDKSDFTLLVESILATGAVVVLPNYALCPDVTLDHIVTQIDRAMRWVAESAHRWGADSNRITVSGHSVGAHLAAMMISAERQPPIKVRAACLVSGIYDIRVVLQTTVNDDVHLDEAMAHRNSPMLQAPRTDLDVVVAVGGAEPSGWIGQSTDYAAHLTDSGAPAWFMDVPDENHFSIIERMAEADHPLTRAIVAQIEGLG